MLITLPTVRCRYLKKSVRLIFPGLRATSGSNNVAIAVCTDILKDTVIHLLYVVAKQIHVQAHWIDCTHHVLTGTYVGVEGVPTWCGI